MNLIELQLEIVDRQEFRKLKEESYEYIFRALKNYKNNFIHNIEDNQYTNIDYNELEIKYSHANFLFDDDTRKPIVRLVYCLYQPNEDYPLYQYDIEYNNSGEFSDEYFMKY